MKAQIEVSLDDLYEVRNGIKGLSAFHPGEIAKQAEWKITMLILQARWRLARNMKMEIERDDRNIAQASQDGLWDEIK